MCQSPRGAFVGGAGWKMWVGWAFVVAGDSPHALGCFRGADVLMGQSPRGLSWVGLGSKMWVGWAFVVAGDSPHALGCFRGVEDLMGQSPRLAFVGCLPWLTFGVGYSRGKLRMRSMETGVLGERLSAMGRSAPERVRMAQEPWYSSESMTFEPRRSRMMRRVSSVISR